MASTSEIDSGIYLITCKASGRFYIGRSKELSIREFAHFRDLAMDEHPNAYLQNVYNKYGHDSLCFEVLAMIPEEDLQEAEQLLLDMHFDDPKCMNISRSAFGGRGSGWKQSDETKKKMSEFRKGMPGPDWSEEERKAIAERTKALWNDPLYREKVISGIKNSGFVYTDEIRAKMSAKKLGRRLTPEWKEKIRTSTLALNKKLTDMEKDLTRQRFSKKTIVKDITAGTERVFDKRQEAAEYIGCSIDVVTRSIKEPDWSPRDYPNIRFVNYGV